MFGRGRTEHLFNVYMCQIVYKYYLIHPTKELSEVAMNIAILQLRKLKSGSKSTSHKAVEVPE